MNITISLNNCLIFLIHFIWGKIRTEIHKLNLRVRKTQYSLSAVMLKTLGFTYLNPYVYSDTVFFLGNFSKDLILNQKLLFCFGASLSSFVAFFVLGYMSRYLSDYLKTKKVWQVINLIIVLLLSTKLNILLSVNILPNIIP